MQSVNLRVNKTHKNYIKPLTRFKLWHVCKTGNKSTCLLGCLIQNIEQPQMILQCPGICQNIFHSSVLKGINVLRLASWQKMLNTFLWSIPNFITHNYCVTRTTNSVPDFYLFYPLLFSFFPLHLFLLLARVTLELAQPCKRMQVEREVKFHRTPQLIYI